MSCSAQRSSRHNRAFHVHRFCASACKVMHLLRTVRTQQTTALAVLFDKEQREAFGRINWTCNDRGWLQASLPCRHGGLGLTPTTCIVEASYAASLIDTYKIVCSSLAKEGEANLEEPARAAISVFTDACKNRPAPLSRTALIQRCSTRVPGEKLQNVLTDEVQRRRVKELYSTATRKELAGLKSCSTSACAMYIVLPSTMIYFLMPTQRQFGSGDRD